MARKKQASTDVASESAEAGSNKPTELTAEERKALHFHHFQKILAQSGIVAKAKDELKKLRKLAKADGLVLADVDFMLRCAEIDDANIVADELKRRTEIAAWFALPVQYQADLFADFADANDRIMAEGEAANYAGKGANDHAFAAGSVEAELWQKGWDRAQAVKLDALQSALEKNNAAKADEDKANLVKAVDAQEAASNIPENIPETAEDPFPTEEEDDPRPRHLKEKHEAAEAVH